MKAKFFPYLLLTPYLVIFVMFLAYPVIRGMYMSLFDWGIFGPNEFVGIDNYTALFQDTRFWRAVRNTFFYTALYVPLVVMISLALAALLKKSLPGIAVIRTFFFLPLTINVAVAAIAIQWLLAPQIGVLNRFLSLLHLPNQSWLDQPGWAMFAVVLVTIWMSAGFNIIIFLAGLENIPQELYEAATIDGSNAWQDFIFITVPLLRSVTLLVAVLSLIGALQVFGEVYLLTQGGPFGSTEVLTYLLYEEGFSNFRFGTAAAIGVVMTFLIAVLSFAQFKLFGERES